MYVLLSICHSSLESEVQVYERLKRMMPDSGAYPTMAAKPEKKKKSRRKDRAENVRLFQRSTFVLFIDVSLDRNFVS